jgi:PAS domain S-box-containing protein
MTHIVNDNEKFIQHDSAGTELRDSMELSQILFNVSPDAIVLINPHDPNISWPIVDCNEMCCNMNGYTRVELIGHSIDMLNITVASAEERTAYLANLRQKSTVHLETSHRHKDGHIFPVEISTSIISLGGHEMVLGIDRDIAERKRIELKLQSNEKQLATIYNTVGDIIFLLTAERDGDYRFAMVNQMFLKVTGLPLEVIVGKRVSEVVPGPSLPMVLSKYKQAILERSVVRWEETTNYPTGQLVGDVSVAPIYDENGNCIQLVGTVHDITKHKHLEEELVKAKSDLTHIIEERTIELKERIVELERFHDATIDRELRMKELRDEVVRLKGQSRLNSGT